MKDLKRLVFVDIEASGLCFDAGMLSIGAVHYLSNKEFYVQMRLDDHQVYEERALLINGFSASDCRNDSLPTQLEAVKMFYKWVEAIRSEYFGKELAIMGGHNIHGDINSLKSVKKSWPFQSRTVDVHAAAFCLFGVSYSAKCLCERLGVTPEAEIHNALEGAKQGLRCFKKMREGNVLSERYN